METPTVSVIIIFLNAERFIREAIESVLRQTYADWELILVDDGSTDASTDAARRHARRDPERIRYVEHPGHVNRGMSASRNLGLSHARGRYVAFLDADDVWLPQRLATHVEVLEKQPRAAMVYGPTLYWHSWSDGDSGSASSEGSGEERSAGEDERSANEDVVGRVGVPTDTVLEPPYLLRRFLESGGGLLPGICSLLARRTSVEDIGGFEEAFRGTYEDQVFLSKMCLNHPVYVIDACLDRYRQHADSCCHQAMETGEYDPDQPHPARERYLRWLQGYLVEQHVGDEALWAALRHELWPYRHPVLYRLNRWRRQGRLKAFARQAARRLLRFALPSSAYQRMRAQWGRGG